MYATHHIQTTPMLESQDARRFVGLSIEEYDAMDGGHYWIDDNDNRTFRCKADVIAYYRTKMRVETVLNELQQRDAQKKSRS